ncbi:hypothetical protein HMPREF9075_00645 [Capnocytophaga sp. oral taxon 332 str. F0381]|nr:hypothetical protein HMPREF9075_00645 [Capnocytophaga sp. oral taxon 332 str. F0381]
MRYPSLNLRSSFAEPSLILRSGFGVGMWDKPDRGIVVFTKMYAIF